jgi:hypothetical protein
MEQVAHFEFGTIYNIDCMDGMKQFPDGYFYRQALERLEKEKLQIRMELTT